MPMRIKILDEPELEFGGHSRHIDPRFGLLVNGPMDRGSELAPRELKVGVVGTSETIKQVRDWFALAKSGLAGKKSRLENLFPAFPGFSKSSCFDSEVTFHDRWCGQITGREIQSVASAGSHLEIVDAAVELFIAYAEDISSGSGPAVIVCAPPENLLQVLDDADHSRPKPQDEGIDEAEDDPSPNLGRKGPPFHDLLKARGMRLGVPLQMLRPSTYDGQTRAERRRRKPARNKSLQDPATRAWNLHVALYYKAGGIPWRLPREQSALSACFVGVSFFRSLDQDRVLTSVAQVFNERGEGVIVKGGPAVVDKTDRRVFLADNDAFDLLRNAIQTYRREHKTMPARVVVHKTSGLVEQEVNGFRAAAEDQNIELLDLVSVKRSFLRLFRSGTYPPLRGTFLELEADRGLLYTRGSIDFFKSYPGMYVPRPLEFLAVGSSRSIHELAAEILALSKLNWNNTQLDGAEPITVNAARRVGDILKCAEDGYPIQPSFRYFI